MVPALPTRVAGVLLLAAGALGFAPPVTESNSEAAPPGIVANIEALVRAADADGTGDLSLPEFSSVVLAARRAHEDAALAADDECACHSENAFRILDGDDSGAVSAGEIEALLAGAVAVSAAELEELLPAGRRALVAASDTSYYTYTGLKAEKKVLKTQPAEEEGEGMWRSWPLLKPRWEGQTREQRWYEVWGLAHGGLVFDPETGMPLRPGRRHGKSAEHCTDPVTGVDSSAGNS